MNIKLYYIKLIMKNKLINMWYECWKVINKLLSKPCNYIYNKKVKKWSDPNNYNKTKLLKRICKEIVKTLIYTDIYLVDSSNMYHDESSEIYLLYDFIKNSKNKYLKRYGKYAYKNDNTNWCDTIIKTIIKNLNDVKIDQIKGKDIISEYSYDYNKYQDTNIYIIELLNTNMIWR